MNYTKRFTDIASKIRELAGIPQQLTDIRKSIEEQGDATRAAYERNQQKEHEQWRRVEVRFDDQEIGRIKTEQKDGSRVQQSIKRAAWCTFWAALIYAVITLFLWLNAHDQLVMEQRSWLVFDPNYSDTLVVGADKAKIAIPFRLVNIGKSPARIIDGYVIVDELRKGERPTFVYHEDRATPIRVGTLYPGAEYAQTTEVHEFTDRHNPALWTELQRREYTDKNQTLFFNVWGRLTYWDVFRQKHFVQFCHAIAQDPAGKTNECVNYNLVDSPTRWDALKRLFER
jgi:hypothetical protein